MVVEYRVVVSEQPSMIAGGESDVTAECEGIPIVASGSTVEEACENLEALVRGPGRDAFAPKGTTIVLRWPDGRKTTLAG